MEMHDNHVDTNIPSDLAVNGGPKRHESFSQASEASQTAQEFIASQLQLEADAREVFPYQFSSCTKPLGPLRQVLFSCLTCNTPPTDPKAAYKPAGVCYSCSISCHGEHELVELFNKRNFVCDCGTTRLPVTSPCTLRVNEKTGSKGDVHSEIPAESNRYNQNFQNRFCGCGKVYDAHKESGVMFQCLGLGKVEEGGCGEDWWHADCIMGLDRDKPSKTSEKPNLGAIEAAGEMPVVIEAEDGQESALPPGFPDEDSFEHFLCYKCTETFPWIKQYANSPGFLAGVPSKPKAIAETETVESNEKSPATGNSNGVRLCEESSRKRKASDDGNHENDLPSIKKSKGEESISEPAHRSTENGQDPYHTTLRPATTDVISLFLCEDFRDHFCRCAKCFPLLAPHAQLLDEEESYEPPVSESDDVEGGSVGSRSLLDRGEAALSNMDRVRAIEGVMAYNHLRDKVKSFLAPFAESGKPVGAEDVKAYFEKLRGDEQAILAAGAKTRTGDEEAGDGDNRREQGGY